MVTHRFPIGALLLFALTVSAWASTPSTSSITVPTSAGVTVTDSWTGTVPIGTDPASDCTLATSLTTDEHDVSVSVGSTTYNTINATFTFQINWTPASGNETTNDLILTVVAPDGSEVASSDGSNPQETVTAANLAGGTYKVLACGYMNASAQAYSATLQITTAAGGTPPPQFLASAGKKWGAPVKVTPTNGYGYEPSFIVDSYGNAFATAHKENAFLALSVDENSPTYTRSMSWAWLSSDNGQTWIDPPGLTALDLEQHQVGDEGDMAQDDAGHIYYVDTYAADVTFTRWTTNGLGSNNVIFDYTRPILPSPETDDRPWTIAHGDGHVFYFSNLGNKTLTGGRYTVHASYDGGLTWDYTGIALPDSGWCRPAADHRAGSQLVYAACTNDGGKLYSYVTTDDGRTWNRYDMGTYNNGDDTQSWPTIQVGPDGTVWVLYVDGFDTKPYTDATGSVTNYPSYNRLYLFKSTDQGKTWTKQDITPVYGRYQYAWLSISADGKKLGFGVYFRSNNGNYPWYAAGATWNAGGKPGSKDLLSLDPNHPASSAEHLNAPGDYMGSYFFPDGKLGAIWTRYVLWTDAATLTRDIYFAKQR